MAAPIDPLDGAWRSLQKFPHRLQLILQSHVAQDFVEDNYAAGLQLVAGQFQNVDGGFVGIAINVHQPDRAGVFPQKSRKRFVEESFHQIHVGLELQFVRVDCQESPGHGEIAHHPVVRQAFKGIEPEYLARRQCTRHQIC